MYYCILVDLTLYINAYDFIFEKQQKSFAKEIYLYIFINLYYSPKLMTYISKMSCENICLCVIVSE